MDHATVAIYDAHADDYRSARQPRRLDAAAVFGRAVPAGRWRADLGCGAGRYTAVLGEPVIAIDAAPEMVRTTAAIHPPACGVVADLEALPVRAAALHGGWASMSYHHMPRRRLPMALAELHRAMAVGAPVDLTAVATDYEGTALPHDDFPGRFFAGWTQPWITDVVAGAGFVVEAVGDDTGSGSNVHIAARRARSLPDTVGPGMRLLVCGLNPSIYSADRGVGYARPGNRFWPAAVAAGIVSQPLDPRHALFEHAVGITDLVKRATVAAHDLADDEYRRGAARVERLVAWLQPRAICFVGLSGYRAAIDRRAVVGVQPEPFGGRPAYVMPSTSGLNAHAKPAEITSHLRAAAALADSS